jgi:hypothetical protein
MIGQILLTILAMFLVDAGLYQVHLHFPNQRRQLVFAYIVVGLAFGYTFSELFGYTDFRLRLLAMAAAALINLNGYLVVLRNKF